MSFEVSDSDEVMHEINMTPLVDVMLVLLVIFMITMPVIEHAVKVQLPRASSQRKQAPAATLQLSVDAEGRYFLGQQALAYETLEERLREEAAREPQPQLHIRGDKKVPYEYVAQAMAAAQRAGMGGIGFVTEGHRP